MSHLLPATLPQRMPPAAVVDFSGRLSPGDLANLNSYAARTHYGAHVVVLPQTILVDNTQELALNMAQTWSLEPQGFLLVVNTHNDSAAMVAGTSLQSKGISSKFVNGTLMPMRFEKEYIQGNLSGAIRSTMVGVERKLNVTAVQGDRATHNHHQTASNWPIVLTFFSFFFFFVLMTGIMGKTSAASQRRMRLGAQGYDGSADLASDLDRIHQVLGGPPAVKQVPMKEFVQRAGLSRSTQNSLDSMPASASHADQASAQAGNYGNQMIAQDALVEKKIVAAESRSKNISGAGKPSLKLIFESASAARGHAPIESQIQPQIPPISEIPTTAMEAQQPASSLEMSVYKPYEFPEDETVVPPVNSLEAAAEVPAFYASLPVGDVAVAPPSTSANAVDSTQTTESVLQVDQYAQVMKSGPDQGTDLTAWQPAAYTMPPTPVLPGAPTMPVSQFAASMNSDFTDVLNRSSSTYASLQQSGFMTPPTTDASSANGKEAAAPGVCPQCQSEKSPDFSFCLRCGHMFV